MSRNAIDRLQSAATKHWKQLKMQEGQGFQKCLLSTEKHK